MTQDQSAWWYIDGRWVHPAEASLPLDDLGLLRGYSAFESLRTYDRRPFHLHEHIQRLFHSAEIIDLEIVQAQAEVESIVRESIVRNPFRHAQVRLLVTGGPSEDGVLPTGQPRLLVLVTPLGERDMERFDRGIKLITSRLQRETPEAKTSSYTAAIRSLKEATRRYASDALFVNELDHVQEATRSNIFIFRGDTLVTPKDEVLIGITRNVVLELARNFYDIEERPILLAELALADEAFLSSSGKEITPVVQIDDIVLSRGKPGLRTIDLEQRFIKMIERGEWAE